LKKSSDLDTKKILTLAEMAHFVRNIPFALEVGHHIWSTPDFFITRKKGSVIDHAILMACMFRSCVFENYNDYDRMSKILKLSSKQSKKE
jgi:hypothetical protein